ncbi:TPA: hypothetical protein DIV48_03320 [Candidatus Kaiserbacteria bacterium]|nr:MAG: hypothetical protein UY93_C0003G0068 [Parcubacteria group bacterium GW2011_GWA1_56_13]HCR52643.1 hypothetical protein [Candidatus Kaiserbacteria bacterium]
MKSNTITLIVLTLLAAAAAYWFFFSGSGNEPPLTVAISTESEAQARFQALASELQPLTFDTGIFSEARFLALVDITTPVTPETAGRLDPFAPVPGVSAK